MFDFSFAELVLIMVVALIVIGPERLPKVARAMGHLWGRAQRYVNGVKADIERDMAVEEYRKLQQQVQEEGGALEQSVKQTALSVDEQLSQINQAVAALAKPENQRQPAQTPAQGGALEQSVKQTALSVDEQLSQINQAVAALAKPENQRQPAQTPAQPAAQHSPDKPE
jgi:sec-independent protein translocase protein TatB